MEFIKINIMTKTERIKRDDSLDSIYNSVSKKIYATIRKEFKDEIQAIAIKEFDKKMGRLNGNLTFEQAVLLACECCENIPIHLIYEHNRKKQVVVARWLVMWYSVNVLKYTLEYTGELLGGHNHSNVSHALAKVDFGTQITLGENIYKWVNEFKTTIQKVAEN